MRLRRLISAVPFTVLALTLAPGITASKDYQRVVPLLNSGKTVLDQPLSYPTDGSAKIQSVIVTMLPGEETGPHTHPYPTYGYILEGELTVSYPQGVQKVYKKGEAVLEAVNTVHDGKNTGNVPVRILVVFMGLEGQPNTFLEKKD
ncbi:MAG: cupin domain-containing protein [Hyphomicrobiales bacterium]|nr:cupin domain-containing protein [Hyphomicrobiales bacterium]MCP4997323.1 cupin domain-containing protein [Hyphomicrobiales bacterium]